jgi:SAM-dependent methyltransferase
LTVFPTACLSVVMPCYNEGATITQAAQRVLASPFTAELIIVDDGSTDETPRLACSLDDPRVRVLSQSVNQGKGAALRRGFAEVTAPFVIVQDADLEDDPSDYGVVLGPLLAGQADVVYGSRFQADRPHRVLYFWHALGNRLLTTLSNMFTNLNLTDMETGYKAFRREVIQTLVIEEDRFGVEPEITAKVAGGQWRVWEVGISYAGRTYEEGKNIGWRDGFRSVYCIVRYSPLRERVYLHMVGRARVAVSPASFGEADRELVATLESLDDATHYAAWIMALARPHLGQSILEVGAGHGTFTELLAAGGADVVGTEISLQSADRLRARFAERPNVEVRHADVAQAVDGERFDTIVLINVLEHIEDELMAVKQLAGGLQPGGRLIIWVPAFVGLYSEFDRRVGHYRRYRIKPLSQLVESTGLRVVEARYVNSLGAVAWWLLATKLHMVPTTTGLVKIYDRAVVPVLRRAETLGSPPFGQSIFLVATLP